MMAWPGLESPSHCDCQWHWAVTVSVEFKDLPVTLPRATVAGPGPDSVSLPVSLAVTE